MHNMESVLQGEKNETGKKVLEKADFTIAWENVILLALGC